MFHDVTSVSISCCQSYNFFPVCSFLTQSSEITPPGWGLLYKSDECDSRSIYGLKFVVWCQKKMTTVRVLLTPFRVLTRINMLTGTTFCGELVPVRGKNNVNHTYKTGLWYMLGVSFKISVNHTRQSYMGVHFPWR